MTPDPETPPPDAAERRHVLSGYEVWSELPMLGLGLVWLVLVVIELTQGLSGALAAASTAIWVIFIVDFGIRIAIAPDRRRYLRHNWLTAISLVVPALRLLRFAQLARLFRVARVARGVRLVRVVGSINRGMQSLGRSMGRRGLPYVIAITAIVTLLGAAGMSTFEDTGTGGLADFGTALWWTAMIMTTMGTEYWPKTAEGRILALLLSIYAFSVFGYVTAALASHFIDRDAARNDTAVASQDAINALRDEVRALKEAVQRGG